ncbi:DNA repair ATPase [Actinomadura harenae]|uniref:AAA family ATPase n=1 Tax=Actinomadura harenae TaxID=2483351 RepID=A0A3M2LY19_9ACTN|nr:DNA repair ATPase [Actinomadura harenae]RMI42414.1 AAA family ATPase [Actinomadura harenae]
MTEAATASEQSTGQDAGQAAGQAAGAGLDRGTYEVLRDRLAARAADLAGRAEALNARRLETFGGSELRLAGSEVVRTAQDRVARDVVSVGGLLLFASNAASDVAAGDVEVGDVFALRRLEPSEDGRVTLADAGLDALPGLLDDPGFRRDFGEMQRYYRQARLLRLRRTDGRLLAVFQTGPRLTDTRVLRWRVDAGGAVSYEDNRGERDDVLPSPFDFTWTEATRDDHVPGRFPHIRVQDGLFVATTGGALTVKAEDDTETGTGVYSEPVDEPLQSLADAEVLHARVGALVLLRVRPYNETAWRHLVFDTRSRKVERLDGIEHACRRLPGDRGVVFPGGYHLDTGVTRTFDVDVTGLEYQGVVRSPNGEDVLYLFGSRADGRCLLLPYNTIRERAAAPITGHGFSLFDDGTLIVLRGSGETPSRAHPTQVWRTPFVSDEHAASRPVGTGPLERVGNADLVGGLADCLAVTRMAREAEPSAEMFRALVSACVQAADRHPWLADPELGGLAGALDELRGTAALAVEEYATVRELTARAAAAVDEAAEHAEALVRRAAADVPSGADGWVDLLAELRRAQGRVETLRDVRHADTARIGVLASSLGDALDTAGRRAVEFLAREDAFTGYHREIDRLAEEAAALPTVAAAEPVTARLAAQTEGLEVVTEVVGSLDVADATVRTAILERVGAVLGGINRARAVLEGRRRDLLDSEGRAAFAAEFALLDQAIAGALAGADTPERCTERLGRLLLRIEALEARFADVDDFLTDLDAKRADVQEAFAARGQALLDERTRRATRLTESADRVLAGLRRRAGTLSSLDEVNAFFAADPMAARLGRITADLRALGDPARAEELDGRLRAARQEAGRALRDRLDLYADDGAAIRLGRHRFAVNARPPELTLVPDGDALAFTVTGTGYHAPVRDEGFTDTRPYWNRTLLSESEDVCRAEYLAVTLLDRAAPGDDLLALVREAAAARYDEGYERGVHDHDAARILEALIDLRKDAGLLRYPSEARAAAQLFWAFQTDEPQRTTWTTQAASLVRAREAFGRTTPVTDLVDHLAEAISGPHADLAAEYLVEELACAPSGFVTSEGAQTTLRDFAEALGDAHAEFVRDLDSLADAPEARRRLAEAWLEPFGDPADLPEAVAIVLCGNRLPRHDSAAALSTTVTGLLGTHPRVTDRTLTLRLDETLARVRRFQTHDVPAFRRYQRRRDALLTAERARLRLDEYRPRTMTSFVRSRLIDEVYLPLIGDNLAKQLGTAGDGRTDRSGLLLLVSPPGYGKTTLMEYVAERLGLLLVRIDGPALGHDVTSLDPARAPSATARREVEKINLAFELGDNVLLYLDDIQHTSPELLQKFIPLCDAQRRVEGVRDGEPRAYDLRGRRFAVCMAGNPYTESGTRFRVPDMLANRADVWNLGDVLTGKQDAFALSFIENALTSNPILAPLSTRDRDDVALLVRLASGDQTVRPDRLSHPYPQAELEQILAFLRKLLHVQHTVLAVNRAYIASAAQSDAARTEPPFRLQGSYRDMNKLAARIVPVMNDDELEAAITDHYTGEAQTLTTDAEANLLKLAELRSLMTAVQERRWADVKAAHQQALTLGDSTDPLTRAVGAITLLADRVRAIESAIDRAANHPTHQDIDS